MASPNWAYAVSQGVAGAAQSAVAGVDRQLKDEADQRAANRELDLKTRLMAADEAMKNRIEDRKRAKAVEQGQAINTGATGLLNTAAAGNINASLGSQIDPANPDSAATLAAIRANPAAMKAYGLPEEDELVKGRARAESARNQGDLAAAGEEDKNVRNVIAEKRAQKNDETTNRRLDIMETFQQKVQERQQTLAEATLAHQKVMEAHASSRDTAASSRAEEAAKREQRQATATALKGVTDDIKALEKEAADIGTPTEKLKVIQSQLQSARQEAQGYRRALAGAGVAAVDAPETPMEVPTPQSIAKMAGSPDDPALKSAFVKRFGQQAYDSATQKKAPAAAPEAKVAPAKPTGLLATEAEYSPPADSPAGQMAARTAAARETQSQADQQRLGSAQALAQKALASRDPSEALQAQDAPGFALLPLDIRNQLFALVRGK